MLRIPAVEAAGAMLIVTINPDTSSAVGANRRGLKIRSVQQEVGGCASGRNVYRGEHNKHPEHRVKQHARPVRNPCHDVFPFFHAGLSRVLSYMRRHRVVCDRHHFFAHLTPIRRAKRPSRHGPRPVPSAYPEAPWAARVRTGKAQSAGYFRCGPQGPGSPSADGGEPSSTGARLGRNGSPLPGAGCDPPHGPAGAGSSASSLSPSCASLGAGSASGPGSWPPANFTSAATRAPTGGWVSKMLENPSRGLSMHISITAEV